MRRSVETKSEILKSELSMNEVSLRFSAVLVLLVGKRGQILSVEDSALWTCVEFVCFGPPFIIEPAGSRECDSLRFICEDGWKRFNRTYEIQE